MKKFIQNKAEKLHFIKNILLLLLLGTYILDIPLQLSIM